MDKSEIIKAIMESIDVTLSDLNMDDVPPDGIDITININPQRERKVQINPPIYPNLKS